MRGRFPVPLLKPIVADGLAHYDEMFLGLDTSEEGALIKRDETRISVCSRSARC